MENKVNSEYLFTIKDVDGQDVVCDALAIIKTEEVGNIIIYTDYTKNEEGKFNVFASKLNIIDGQMSLEELNEEEVNLDVIQKGIFAGLETLEERKKKQAE